MGQRIETATSTSIAGLRRHGGRLLASAKCSGPSTSSPMPSQWGDSQ